ncbi:MAG: phosphotriesterase-related protein [bacterium]
MSMTDVHSVLGPIPAQKLGVTLVHEHLVYGFPGWRSDTAAPPYDRQKIFVKSVEAMEEAKALGLKTLVDATPIDGSRDPELYRMVSLKTGIQIICATGLANEPEGSPNYFQKRAWMTGNPGQVVEDMCESFVKDITEGIGGSGVKAGVIKVGTSKGKVTEYEKMVLRAAAMAQRKAGVPIITHTEEGTMGPEQAGFLAEQGADMSRVMIGHIDSSSMDYLHAVLQKGASIGFDRFGVDYYFADADRIRSIAELVRAGFEDRIMLSHDRVIHWPGREIVLFEAARPLVANWKLTHIFKNIVPALKAAGVTGRQVETMMIDNPRRLFAGS